MVHEVSKAVRIPVIGMGGIACLNDVIEFLIAGASMVQVGTINFTNPMICPELIKGLKEYLKNEKIKDLKDLIGSLEISQ